MRDTDDQVTVHHVSEPFTFAFECALCDIDVKIQGEGRKIAGIADLVTEWHDGHHAALLFSGDVP